MGSAVENSMDTVNLLLCIKSLDSSVSKICIASLTYSDLTRIT